MILIVFLQLVKEDELPPSDAIKDLLPDYVMTDSDVTTGAVSKERQVQCFVLKRERQCGTNVGN